MLVSKNLSIMKEFVKTTLAVMCGIFVMGIIGFFFSLIMIGSMAATAGTGNKPVLPKEMVLDIDLSTFTLTEQASNEQFNIAALQGGETIPQIGIWDAVQSIKAAAADHRVKYIILRGDSVPGGMADAEELRDALADFRESGKPVVAYTEAPGNGSFYLYSVADKIFMSKHGENAQLIGIAGRMVFLKDLLDKLGVNYQLIRHGKYKSAGETFIKNAPSPENYEQNKVMINSMWKTMSGAIAEGRDISVDKLNDLVDNLKLCFPEDFLKEGLIDEIVDHEELIERLCSLAVVEDKDDLNLVPFTDYAKVSAPVPSPAAKNQIAVIYADGDIVEGDAIQNIAGDRFVRVIDKVRSDENVKAVVLRVNSPGGSVKASSKIKDALDLLKAEKPLVASYGNYAASGGYWISNNCSKIFSDATCLTGSIGVFAMIPEVSKTLKNVAHINVVTVGSNKHSDMYSLMRPLNSEETAFIQRSIESVYDNFVGLVAEGRGLEIERVDEIGQGRVWTGADAIGIGLVDEIGTLRDAVEEAASMAGYISESDYTVSAWPRPLTPFEQIMEMIGMSQRDKSILAGTPFAEVGKALKQLKETEPSAVYARLPYSIEIK